MLNNTTKITAATFEGCISYEDSQKLYIPYEFKTLENINYVLKFEAEDHESAVEDYADFLSQLDFALNVAISNGFSGMEKHLDLNGYGFMNFVGVMKTGDFLKNTDADILNDLNLELYK